MNCRYLASGDQTVLVEFPEKISPQINFRVRSFERLLKQCALPAVKESLPAYRSLAVNYDPLKISFDELVRKLQAVELELTETSQKGTRQIDIPVCYGGKWGPDLEFVARANQLSPDQVVKIHSSGEYVVYFLGFSPGFPYLGGMSESIASPRLDRPRSRVPAGSVAIGGSQTGIYSIEGPGGWRIIGRTPRVLFRPHDEAPFLIQSGDRVRFRPISESEFTSLGLTSPAMGLGLELNGKPVFEVRKPGLLSTIQDGGRLGFQCQGVPTCGAMDRYALRLGNLLVGNPQGTAALEITVAGPELQVLAPCQIAVAGGDLSPLINGAYLKPWENHWIEPGQTLSFGSRRWGARSYLCLRGGLAGDEIMGSCSTDLNSRFGGFHGRRLEKGDILYSRSFPGSVEPRIRRRVPADLLRDYDERRTVRVIAGPQADCFTQTEIDKLHSSEYRISPNANRMGYFLEGFAIAAQKPEIISDPVPFGALQVLPGGQVVLLMADHQTVGGYPKIAVVITADLPKVAQLNIGEKIRFRLASLDLAHQLLRAQEAAIERGVLID